MRLLTARISPLLLAAVLAAGLTACGKSKSALPAAPQPEAVNTQPLAGEVNAAMTQQLRAFIQLAGRAPTNFTELARSRLDMVPRTRPGTIWAIDYATQEVKLVPR